MSEHNITVTPSSYSYPLLIKQLLHSALTIAPDQEIVYHTLRYTYRDFYRRLGRLANALSALGVGPGQTVAVMDWDTHRYLECFFAVPMMGAVLQTVNVRLAPEQILYTLNHAQADVLLVNAEFAPVLSMMREQLSTVKTFVLLADEPDSGVFQIPYAGEYEALLARESAEFSFPELDENTRATTFYTTGTTGLPKGVYFSHRQLVLHTLAVATGLCASQGQNLHRQDVYMPITPMFHVHAWGMPYIATMLGLKQVYPGRYTPERLLSTIEQEKVTFSHCVPTILHMLLHAPGQQHVDLRGWKVIIGGSSLPKGLAAEALARGIDVFTGYGMSETCPILTFSRVSPEVGLDDVEGQLNARIKTGQPVPLVDLQIVDGDVGAVPADDKTPGEVVVRAPWLTQGYLHNPPASEALWAGGYLHTGDIGVIDAHGNMRITDRMKDVIKTGGEWVSSLELESIISQHPAVNEVAVIGVKDEKWGERPLALVVLKAGQTVSAEALREVVRQSAAEGHISRYAVPEQIRFVEALARTSVGKLNKKALREQLA